MRVSLCSPAALLLIAATLGLPASAQEDADPGPSVTAEVVGADNGDAGAYLAARVAEGGSDFRAAAAWYDRALAADPGNLALSLIYAALPCVLKLIAIALLWRTPIGKDALP